MHTNSIWSDHMKAEWKMHGNRRRSRHTINICKFIRQQWHSTKERKEMNRKKKARATVTELWRAPALAHNIFNKVISVLSACTPDIFGIYSYSLSQNAYRAVAIVVIIHFAVILSLSRVTVWVPTDSINWPCVLYEIDKLLIFFNSFLLKLVHSNKGNEMEWKEMKRVAKRKITRGHRNRNVKIHIDDENTAGLTTSNIWTSQKTVPSSINYFYVCFLCVFISYLKERKKEKNDTHTHALSHTQMDFWFCSMRMCSEIFPEIFAHWPV